ncbi:hypothetical protein ACT7BI_001540 [Cronobacter turicensis]
MLAYHPHIPEKRYEHQDIACRFFLFAGSLNNAMADNCRANIFGGEDTRNSDGSSSSSRANIFDGQETQYSDGSSSSSRANIFDGQDTQYSDGRSSSSRANIFDSQDTINN